MSLTPERLAEIRGMRFVASLNAAAGHFATDEERALYRLAAEHYNARLELLAEVDRQATEIDRLTAALAARPTRAEVLREAADTLAAACPDHGERSECRMTCACDVAAELRMDADGHPLHDAPTLTWLPLLSPEDREDLAEAIDEDLCGGTDNYLRGLVAILDRYRRRTRHACVDGGAR